MKEKLKTFVENQQDSTDNNQDELITKLLEDMGKQYLPLSELMIDLLSIKLLNDIHQGVISRLSKVADNVPFGFNEEALKEAKKRLLSNDYSINNRKILPSSNEG